MCPATAAHCRAKVRCAAQEHRPADSSESKPDGTENGTDPHQPESMPRPLLMQTPILPLLCAGCCRPSASPAAGFRAARRRVRQRRPHQPHSFRSRHKGARDLEYDELASTHKSGCGEGLEQAQGAFGDDSPRRAAEHGEDRLGLMLQENQDSCVGSRPAVGCAAVTAELLLCCFWRL